MIIALDFDQTYTVDPQAWNEFIELMQRHGHTVYCVTMRDRVEGEDVHYALGKRVDGIFCTNRQAKRQYMLDAGINIDVWIDDQPGWILQDAADRVVKAPAKDEEYDV